jgi:hypothetical protein
MAQTGLTIRTKLNQRVFVAPPATSCILTPVTTTMSGTFGGYDGNTVTYGEATIILAVPYGVLSDMKNYNSYGLDNDGEMKLAVKHTVSTTIGDQITITSLSGTFQVVEIEPYPYDGINLCTILTIKQTLSD